MTVVPIRKQQPQEEAAPKTKIVPATQKAVDALPLDSGTWRIQGVPGLYIRCRSTSKSYFVQRRVDRELVREYLERDITVKEARATALKNWADMKPKPAPEGKVTLESAIKTYIENRQLMKKMAETTRKLAEYNMDRYLEDWKARELEAIGKDRAGILALHARLTRKHGRATCNQVMRLLSAVYRWHQDTIDSKLPEWPRKAGEIHEIKARDWAYSEQDLKAWWSAPKTAKDGQVVKKDGKVVMVGVSTLSAIKKTWWVTALFTGARKGSIEALKWSDVDLDKKTIHFRVTKGDRPYIVPISDTLAELLARYRKSEHVPPSDWVFPSSVLDGHLKNVKNPNEGVGPAHRLRHTFRTTLAQIGATPDQARMLMGHSMGGDVSRGYITSSLVVESLRPVANAVAEQYAKILLTWEPFR